jgi:hypothetical protein
MGFRRSDLQEAFFVPGSYAFRVYGYGTSDPLEEVLAPGYFALGTGLLRPGDLIYVSTCPPQGTGAAGEPHMALVMAQSDAHYPARASGSVRLVQDFGRPTDAPGPLNADAAPEALASPPTKRGRGRPPGSRNKKTGLSPAPADSPGAPTQARA